LLGAVSRASEQKNWLNRDARAFDPRPDHCADRPRQRAGIVYDSQVVPQATTHEPAPPGPSGGGADLVSLTNIEPPRPHVGAALTFGKRAKGRKGDAPRKGHAGHDPASRRDVGAFQCPSGLLCTGEPPRLREGGSAGRAARAAPRWGARRVARGAALHKEHYLEVGERFEIGTTTKVTWSGEEPSPSVDIRTPKTHSGDPLNRPRLRAARSTQSRPGTISARAVMSYYSG
jgi:hypothetical protein